MSDSHIRRLIDWSTRTFRKNRASAHDDELVAAVLRGDQKSLGELYERHHAMLVRFLDRLGCADPDDLVQEVFLSIRKKLEGYSSRGDDLGKWLRRVTYNMYRTHRRSVGRRRIDDVSMERVANDESSISGKLSRADLVEHLLKFLTPQQRELLVLSNEGFSADELATMHETTPGNINVRLTRARQALRAKQDEIARLAGRVD